MANLIAAGRQFWARLRQNPIVQFHLSRKQRVPMWLVVGLGVGLWLLSLGGMVYLLWQRFEYIIIVWLMAFYAIWFGPLLIGSIGAQFANREIKHQRHQLILMTPLPAVDVVWAYMIVALHRARVLVAIFLGMSPILAMFVAFFSWGPWTSHTRPSTILIQLLAPIHFIHWAVGNVAVVLLICATLPLLLAGGINAGVYNMRMRHGRDTPVLTQVRLYFASAIVTSCMMPWLPGEVAALIAASYYSDPLILGVGLLLLVVILLLLWLFTWLLIRLAVSNLRKAPVPGE